MTSKVMSITIIMKGEDNMKQSIFEKSGGTYSQFESCFLPNLIPDENKSISIGLWGQRHLQYIKEYRPILYNNLVLSGKLNSYLVEIDKQALERLEVIIQQSALYQGVTEELKAADPLVWVGRMNNIRCAAEEIVNSELIFS